MSGQLNLAQNIQSTNHPGLAEIPAHVGSQEVMSQLKHDPFRQSCTQADINQSTLSIRGCVLQLPGTHRVQEFLLTKGAMLLIQTDTILVYIPVMTCFISCHVFGS